MRYNFFYFSSPFYWLFRTGVLCFAGLLVGVQRAAWGCGRPLDEQAALQHGDAHPHVHMIVRTLSSPSSLSRMSETDSGCLYLFTDIYPRVEPCTLYPPPLCYHAPALGVNVIRRRR